MYFKENFKIRKYLIMINDKNFNQIDKRWKRILVYQIWVVHLIANNIIGALTHYSI